jgi:hypothetical protein
MGYAAALAISVVHPTQPLIASTWLSNLTKRAVKASTSSKSSAYTSQTASSLPSLELCGTSVHSFSTLTFGYEAYKVSGCFNGRYGAIPTPTAKPRPTMVVSATNLDPASITSSGFPIAEPASSALPPAGMMGVSIK